MSIFAPLASTSRGTAQSAQGLGRSSIMFYESTCYLHVQSFSRGDASKKSKKTDIGLFEV
jgi:hypothetical protein